jgi:hypothetical protein
MAAAGAPANHIDTGEVQVHSSAEAGVSDEGPGAQVTVDPPWEGYDRLRAVEIIDRLQAADPSERALVRLYESTHRRRVSILRVVE